MHTICLHGSSLKTGPSSSIISKLVCDRSGALAYFYFDFRDDQKQDMRGLLSSCIFQLADKDQRYHTILTTFYEENSNSHLEPPTDILMLCLKSMIHSSQILFLIIDAFDECTERSDLGTFISNLINMNHSSLRLLVTSRIDYDIQKIMCTHHAHYVHLNEDPGHAKDISAYVRARLSDSIFSDLDWPRHVREHAEQALISKANGMCELSSSYVTPHLITSQVLVGQPSARHVKTLLS